MDQFERIRKIGKGNFGDVLLVQRKLDGKLFALKRVDLTMRESFVVDPLNEIKILKALDHPNIIKHYESFIQNNKLCIVMEYAEDADLGLKVREAKQNQQKIPESTVLYFIYAFLQILPWLTQLAVALNYLHSQKILHRDIKVQNIFLCSGGIVKLGDFGISRTLENTLELAQTSIGTPFYLSPELCQNQSYNHKIDIWMLGCAIYELCALQKPFIGDSINAIAYKITHDQHTKIPSNYSSFLSNLVDSMLEKSPEKRPDTQKILQFTEIQAELQKINSIYNKPLPQPQLSSSHKKSIKMQQNSIHFLVEKSKQQQGSSPNCSRNQSKLATPQQTYKTHAIDQNSPHFKLGGKQALTNLHTLPDYIDQIKSVETTQRTEQNENNPKLKYQKSISINTQIERTQDLDTIENQPTLIKNKKSFTFFDMFLNPNTPASPNRSILLTDFLKRKLGEEKFYSMKQLLEQHNDPMNLLENQQNLVSEIIGEQNMDCIRIFKLLISCSITPQASHGRAKSAQVFQQKQDNLIDFLKEQDFQQEHETIGQNAGWEISFKNLHLQ